MIVPYLVLIGQSFFSFLFVAISLFTNGWVYIPIDYDLSVGVGLIPFLGNDLVRSSYTIDELGWLVATSIFMYLAFSCVIITCIVVLIGLVVYLLKKNTKLQVIFLFSICASTLLSSIFGSTAFIIFVVNYERLSDIYYPDYIDVTIGFSPFLNLIGVIFLALETGTSAFCAIMIMNKTEQ